MGITVNINRPADNNAANSGKINNDRQTVRFNHNQSRTADNLISAKRNSARKQAMKLISDAWERDNKYVSEIAGMKDERSVKVNELKDMNEKSSYLEKEKELLREEYGVEADSQEQDDLKLLEKYQRNKLGYAMDSFSDEERARLKELESTGLTDYQKKALEISSLKECIDSDIEDMDGEIKAIAKSITSAEIDRPKSQDMLKSKEAADTLIEASEKEIAGMLINEAKEHIEEVQEEQEKKAKEEEEKKEERDERIKEAKEKRKEQEEIIEKSMEADKIEQHISVKTQSVDYMNEARRQIKQILKENNMINADLIGIEIDLDF